MLAIRVNVWLDGRMTRTTETVNPLPYEVELVREDERVVEVTVRAVEGAELTYMHVRSAMQAVLDLLPRYSTEQQQRRLRVQHERNAHVHGMLRSGELRLPPRETEALLNAYARADGRVTDDYLAHLAVAYAAAALEHRDVSQKLSEALGRPLQTIKGHVMRARKEGFLTATVEGREGGEATDKALALAGGGDPNLAH